MLLLQLLIKPVRGGSSNNFNTAEIVSPPTMYQKMSFNVKCRSQRNRPSPPQRYAVPLQFWFCRNPGLALPLIALQYHIKVKLTLAPASDL